jgi:hypothetical protein
MRVLIALVLSAALCGASLGAECTLYNARYKQPDAPWWLTFQRVPQFAAANQTASFFIKMPNSDLMLEGAVHVPNGFGSPLWSITGPCSPDSAEICAFVGENDMPSAYGIYDGKVGFLNSERGSTAPEQLILPQLAVSIWYSEYRNTEWLDGTEPGDAFMLDGCE